MPPRTTRRIAHLTPVCLALVVSACASASFTRRTPTATAADSLLATTYLNQIIVTHTRHVLEHDASLRLALGLRLDRLPAGYANGPREEARYARSVLRDLERVRYDALSQDDYLTLLAVHWDASNQSEAPVYRRLDLTALVPGASPLPSIARALALHPLDEDQDLARYLYLLDNLGLFFGEQQQLLREQAAAGITIPRIALDTVISFLNSFRQPGMRSPYALTSERLTHVDSSVRAAVAASLAQRIDADVNVRLDSLIAYLDGAYRGQLPDTSSVAPVGLGRYAGGREYYQFLLHRRTTLDAAPAEVYRYGVSEVERIVSVMGALRASLGFAGSDSAFRDSLRTVSDLRVESPNDFERRVREALSRIGDTVRARLSLQLRDTLYLVARAAQPLDGAHVVHLREGDAIDPHWRLEYVVERVTRLPAYVIPAIVAREILPGRYALLSAVQRHDSLATIRQLMRFDGFVDGWSEYARALAGELGLYADRLHAYGALMLELEASARMVADIGLHYYGWNYPEAVRYLRLYSVDPSSAPGDALRIAVAEPARAVAAKLGSRELAGQRAWVRRQLGSDFDDARLQRELFRVGVLPLPILSQHLAWFVWKERQNKKGMEG